jgi:hypothetical protein
MLIKQPSGPVPDPAALLLAHGCHVRRASMSQPGNWGRTGPSQPASDIVAVVNSANAWR